MSTINIDVIDSATTKELVNSVDAILFDIDGVLLLNYQPIPGSIELIEKLRKLGKKIVFVTNNALSPLEKLMDYLKPFKAVLKEVYNPTSSFLDYMKKIDFKKDIFTIASKTVKSVLRDAGFNIIDYESFGRTELNDFQSIKELSLEALDRCKNVGIVYVDVDFNCCYGSVHIAQVILNLIENVQLVSACPDDLGPLSNNLMLAGPKYYIEPLERWSTKKVTLIGKPEKTLANIIQSNVNISDSRRILMIGDTVESDMKFGVNGGFKTCLVLSGIYTKDKFENWNEPENLKPNYVSASVQKIYEKIIDM